MEILQTIWNALTTENVIFINFISFPMLVLELIISVLLFTTILNIQASTKQKIIYILLLSTIGLINIIFVPAPFNTFINLIACPLLVYFIFKTSILKALLSEIVPYVFFIVIGAIVGNLYTSTFKISNQLFNSIPIHKIIGSLFMYLFVYLIYIFIKYYKINIKNIELNKKNSKLLLFNFIIGILGLFVESFIATFYTDYLPPIINLSSVLILFIYFSITLYSLLRTVKLEQTTESLEEEKLYNKTLTILYDNIRGFKHDFNNIVQAIGGYISTDNMDGLKDYYTDLLEDCQKINNLAILNPELINNPAVYSLLTSKYHKAEELGIKMNFEVFLDLETLNIKTYDLTRILGILLDNSIEASSKCDEKEIYITIRKDSKANRQLFIIENTYTNKDVNTDRIFEKGYTSKVDEDNKNHGLGLWEVRQILKKNNNLNLFTKKTNKLFKQQLEIYL